MASHKDSDDEDEEEGSSACCCVCRCVGHTCKGCCRCCHKLMTGLCWRKAEDACIYISPKVLALIGMFSSTALILHQQVVDSGPAFMQASYEYGSYAIQTTYNTATDLYAYSVPIINGTYNTYNQLKGYTSLTYTTVTDTVQDHYDTILPFLNQTSNYLRKKLDEGV